MEHGNALSTADLIAAYASRTRQELQLENTPVVSYAGLWLLLASLAPAAEGSSGIEAALGLPARDAAAMASELLTRTPECLQAAVGAWLRAGESLHTEALPVAIDELRDQEQLDAWAKMHTNGKIESFPCKVDEATSAAFASALAVETRWAHELDLDDDGLLKLNYGRQFLMETAAAGIVAVAIPDDKDGTDVVSVIASPDVAPSAVWEAVDEVLAALSSNVVSEFRPVSDGHSWTVTEVEETFVVSDLPDQSVVYRSHLPSWRADASLELPEVSGIPEVAAALAGMGSDFKYECAQSASASYSKTGFKAAAVTGMTIALTGMPEFTTIRVSQIDLTFDRAHAVVAVARGGHWDRVPLFHAWVTPELWTSYEPKLFSF